MQNPAAQPARPTPYPIPYLRCIWPRRGVTSDERLRMVRDQGDRLPRRDCAGLLLDAFRLAAVGADTHAKLDGEVMTTRRSFLAYLSAAVPVVAIAPSVLVEPRK